MLRTENLLLAALNESAKERIYKHLELVRLPSKFKMHEQGAEMKYVYFLEKGLVSLVYRLPNGEQSGVGLIGREGVVGALAFAGSNHSFVEAIVYSPCHAMRMPAENFRQEFFGEQAEEHGSFASVISRFVEKLNSQSIEIALCNKHHSVEGRLARWISLCNDKQGESIISSTQEFLSVILGVYRPSVTLAAQSLAKAGAITYKNGTISVINRGRLEELSCECRKNSAQYSHKPI